MNTLREICLNRGWFYAIGVVLILLGTVALATSVFTTLITMIFLGSLMLVAGGVQFLQAFWLREWRGFFLHILIGVLYAVVGWLMLVNPGVSAISLTLLLAAFFLVSGLSKIVTALSVNFSHWGWLLFNGIVSLLLGVLILVQWPYSGLWVIGAFLGIDMIFSGWTFIMLAASLTKRKCAMIHIESNEEEKTL